MIDSDVSIESRLAALESVSAAIRAVHIKGLQCDDGPYDAQALSDGWLEDGVFKSGSLNYAGKEAIRNFYSSLSAVFTIHFYTNLIITVDSSTENKTLIELYGFETPIINRRSAVGLFSHCVSCSIIRKQCFWNIWVQKVFAIAPFVEGWENGERILIQTK